MTSEQTFVIVGASLAGAKAAETLRAEGFDGRVVLIGAEDERPYERPPLSKDYLRGEVGREKVYVHDEGFYAEHDIELRLGRAAVSLDASTRRGGARRRRAAALRPAAAHHRRRAAAARDPRRRPRRRALPAHRRRTPTRCASGSTAAAGGRRRRRLDRRRGRRLRAPARPRRHRHRPGAGPARARARHRGRRRSTATSTPTTACGCCWAPASRPSRATSAVERVRTSDGRALECDFVVVGVGVQPRTELAAEAGLAVDNGILVDEHLQTSAPGVFAAGDVANAAPPLLRRADPRRALGQRAPPGPGGGAQHARPSAAPTTACRTSSPTSTTSAWSTPASPARWDRVVFRGDPASREFIAFWLAADRVVAGMNVNVWDVTDPIQRLIRERVAGRRPRASPTPTSRSRTSPPTPKEHGMNRLQRPARRRRLDLARHALARAARQRRLRAR